MRTGGERCCPAPQTFQAGAHLRRPGEGENRVSDETQAKNASRKKRKKTRVCAYVEERQMMRHRYKLRQRCVGTQGFGGSQFFSPKNPLKFCAEFFVNALFEILGHCLPMGAIEVQMYFSRFHSSFTTVGCVSNDGAVIAGTTSHFWPVQIYILAL